MNILRIYNWKIVPRRQYNDIIPTPSRRRGENRLGIPKACIIIIIIIMKADRRQCREMCFSHSPRAPLAFAQTAQSRLNEFFKTRTYRDVYFLYLFSFLFFQFFTFPRVLLPFKVYTVKTIFNPELRPVRFSRMVKRVGAQ